MQEQDIKLKSSDGLNLCGSVWFCDDQAIGTILIIHGLGEHHRRYSNLANKFNKKGFNVVAYDQRGHGISDGKRGHSPTQDHLLDDLKLFIDYANNQFKLPVVTYGHSFGGNVLCTYLLKRKPNDISGAIISSAWLRLAFEPPYFKVLLGKMMNFIWPSFTQNNELNSDGLTYDEQINQRYLKDDLVHGDISASLFLNAFESAKWCLDNAHQLNIKSLIIHGEDDPIVSSKGSELFHQKSSSSDIKIWSKTKHEPHNDLKSEEVFLYVLNWIKKEIF